MAPAARRDVVRVGLGAAIGLGITAALVHLAQRAGWQDNWMLFAPLGATAVLVFAVHTGPLSQPWSCVVGNTVAALWTCRPGDSLHTLAALFQQHPIKSMPVVDGDGRLLGVVSRHTLLDWLWQPAPAQTHRQRSRWPWRRTTSATPPSPNAATLMQPAPLSVEDDTPVSALLATLAVQTVPFVAVLHAGRLVGLITRTDIMRILLQGNAAAPWTARPVSPAPEA